VEDVDGGTWKTESGGGDVKDVEDVKDVADVKDIEDGTSRTWRTSMSNVLVDVLKCKAGNYENFICKKNVKNSLYIKIYIKIIIYKNICYI
jgi:hypothetical protein